MDFVIILWNKDYTVKQTIPCDNRGVLYRELKKLKGQMGSVYLLQHEGSVYQQHLHYKLEDATK